MAVVATLATGAALAVNVPGQGTWETTLQPRDLDGNAVNGPEAFYDTALNITWLRNAHFWSYADWLSASTSANTLVVGGVGGWRLPTMVDTGAPGCDSANSGTDCGFNVQTATSEMAHLWYATLGNKAYCDSAGSCPQPGWGLTNTGDFQNLSPDVYWTGLQLATYGAYVWYFNTGGGLQSVQPWDSFGGGLAIAVHPGDVAAVPEPQGAALMLIGLTGLALALRRRPS